MGEKRRWQCLDGTTLKLIAMASMVFDHVGDSFFPGQVWMRAIGRMALPIFAFCVAEGYGHTHDKRRYLLRMGLFACVSEVPFDLVAAGVPLEFSHQNVMATFFWAILGLLCSEGLVRDGSSKARKAGGAAVLVLFAVLSVALGLDYHMLGVGLVFVYHLPRDKALAVRNAAAAGYHVLTRNVGIHWFGLLGFAPPLPLRRGARARAEVAVLRLLSGTPPSHLPAAACRGVD